MKKLAVLVTIIFGLGLFLAAGAYAAGDYGSSGKSRSEGQSGSTGVTDQSSSRAGQQGMAKAHAQKASKIIGSDVENPQGQKIGGINELVVDPTAGRVSYAIVSVGGFLGVGERNIAVPFSALRYRASDNKLVLNMSKDRLEQAPSVDRNTDVSSPEFRQKVDAFYRSSETPSGAGGRSHERSQERSGR